MKFHFLPFLLLILFALVGCNKPDEETVNFEYPAKYEYIGNTVEYKIFRVQATSDLIELDSSEIVSAFGPYFYPTADEILPFFERYDFTAKEMDFINSNAVLLHGHTLDPDNPEPITLNSSYEVLSDRIFIEFLYDGNPQLHLNVYPVGSEIEVYASIKAYTNDVKSILPFQIEYSLKNDILTQAQEIRDEEQITPGHHVLSGIIKLKYRKI